MNTRSVIYSRFKQTQLILRDELAIDRTLLANERTLLAYLRSGVALLISGVSIMHFAHTGWFWLVGLLCIPVGIVAGAIGVFRYWAVNRRLGMLRALPHPRAASCQDREGGSPD